MDKKQILKELAEEIRTNSRLRHRLGMEEGSESVVVDEEDANGIIITTIDGDQFAIVVADEADASAEA